MISWSLPLSAWECLLSRRTHLALGLCASAGLLVRFPASGRTAGQFRDARLSRVRGGAGTVAGSRLVHLRMPALTAASERSGWEMTTARSACWTRSWDTLPRSADLAPRRPRVPATTASALTRSATASTVLAMLPSRSWTSESAPIPAARRRRAPSSAVRFGPLAQLGIEVGGVLPALVTQAKPRAQAKSRAHERFGVRLRDREDRRGLFVESRITSSAAACASAEPS